MKIKHVLSIEEVEHIAKLSGLYLTAEEFKKIGKQLSQTIDYIQNLKELDTRKTKPTSNVSGLHNICREDIIEPSFTQEKALVNTNNTYNGFFKVKAILEEK